MARWTLPSSGTRRRLPSFAFLISKPSAVRSVSRRPVASERRKPVAAISPSMQWNVRGVIEPAGASSSAASMIRLISVKDSR